MAEETQKRERPSLEQSMRVRRIWGLVLFVIGALGLLLTWLLRYESREVRMILIAFTAVGAVRTLIATLAMKRLSQPERP